MRPILNENDLLADASFREHVNGVKTVEKLALAVAFS